MNGNRRRWAEAIGEEEEEEERSNSISMVGGRDGEDYVGGRSI